MSCPTDSMSEAPLPEPSLIVMKSHCYGHYRLHGYGALPTQSNWVLQNSLSDTEMSIGSSSCTTLPLSSSLCWSTRSRGWRSFFDPSSLMEGESGKATVRVSEDLCPRSENASLTGTEIADYLKKRWTDAVYNLQHQNCQIFAKEMIEHFMMTYAMNNSVADWSNVNRGEEEEEQKNVDEMSTQDMLREIKAMKLEEDKDVRLLASGSGSLL
eukprot:PhF_6_TR10536/c0_g1_i1/m.16635